MSWLVEHSIPKTSRDHLPQPSVTEPADAGDAADAVTDAPDAGTDAEADVPGVETEADTETGAADAEATGEPDENAAAVESETEPVSEPVPESEPETPVAAPAPESGNGMTAAPAIESDDDTSSMYTTAELIMPDDTGRPAEAKPASEVESDVEEDYSASGYNNNIKNIVLIGVDRYELGEQPTFRSAGQSDTVMILSFDLRKKEYFFISVNRDLDVPVENFSLIGESYGFVNEQIALAYAYGDGTSISGKNVIKSLNCLFDNRIPFQGFIAAPMTIISTLADAVDGVPVEIVDDFTGVDDTLKKGEVAVLRGEHAEKYIRARKYMKKDPYNEFRMTRQFAFCESFINKAKTTMTAKQLVSLYEDVMDMMVTNIGKNEITKWIATIYDYDFKGFYRIDGEYGELKHNAPTVIPDPDEVTELLDDLYFKKDN